jgi:hypothetical protein
MRRLFWISFLLGAYFWIVTSGNDQAVLEKGKKIYETVVAWFDDADIDYQLKKGKSQKRHRRWD